MFCGGNPLCAGTQVMARRFDSLKLDGIPAGNTMGGSVKSTKLRVFSSQAVALIVVNREAVITLFAEPGCTTLFSASLRAWQYASLLFRQLSNPPSSCTLFPAAS